MCGFFPINIDDGFFIMLNVKRGLFRDLVDFEKLAYPDVRGCPLRADDTVWSAFRAKSAFSDLPGGIIKAL